MSDLLLSVVLDKSGSMMSVRDATIAGFNELLHSQKKEKGKTFVSLTLFDTQTELRHVLVPLSDVPLLTRETYQPGGWTALYDAIGETIRAIEEAQQRGTDLPERLMVVVMTDGHENSSARYSQRDIFDLVKRKKSEGWAFMFLGCDIDAYDAGAQVGISRGSTVSYSAGQTAQTYNLVSDAARAYRAGNVTADSLATPPSPPDPAGPTVPSD